MYFDDFRRVTVCDSGRCQHPPGRWSFAKGSDESTQEHPAEHTLRDQSGRSEDNGGDRHGDPLVNCYITMESHHVEWVNQWVNQICQWSFSLA